MNFKTYLLISLVILCIGCGKTVRVPVEQPVCVSNTDVEEVMDRCATVLQKFGFVIEKFDVDVGYIRTRPLRGGQFFEVWRRDNIGHQKVSEASIHSVRRIAEIQLRQDAGKICVNCIVNKERLGMVDEEPLMWTKVSQMYTGGTGRLTPDPENEDIYWIEMGEDELLENAFLKELYR